MINQEGFLFQKSFVKYTFVISVNHKN